MEKGENSKSITFTHTPTHMKTQTSECNKRKAKSYIMLTLSHYKTCINVSILEGKIGITEG